MDSVFVNNMIWRSVDQLVVKFTQIQGQFLIVRGQRVELLPVGDQFGEESGVEMLGDLGQIVILMALTAKIKNVTNKICP